MISRIHGHADVGLGTVLGSNVFNNLWIVGLAGMIRPIDVEATDVVVAVVACLIGLALAIPGRSGLIPRWRGGALLATVTAYTIAGILSAA